MSKQRARQREQRQAQTAARTEHRAASARASARSTTRRRRRRTARQRWWRQLRLWHNGPHAGRNRDRWAALVIAVLVVLLLTYLVTSSWAAVGLMVLVTALACPALIAVVSDRSSP